jgi:hypothetical protein
MQPNAWALLKSLLTLQAFVEKEKEKSSMIDMRTLSVSTGRSSTSFREKFDSVCNDVEEDYRQSEQAFSSLFDSVHVENPMRQHSFFRQQSQDIA